MKISPDSNANGFLRDAPDANRYGYTSMDPRDAAMKILSLIAPGSKVLDVGCGNGALGAAAIRTKRAIVIGIEPDSDRVALARANGLEVTHGYLSREFVELNGPFDYCIFADVLEHVPNPAELVLIAKEGLSPGGSIIASVPNIAHWSVRLNLLMGRFNYTPTGIMDATHLRWFTRRVARDFFQNLGFLVTSLDATVNIGLPCYGKGPWRLIPGKIRRRLVGVLVHVAPGTFGCQHIIRATLSNG